MATRNVKYKCPFCGAKYNREDLVIHVEDKHPYEIPKDFTPFRYVFNYVNKKPLTYHGKCTECGGPTEWDENKGRYNRQCDKKACHDSYIKKFEANMMKTRGITRISATAEGQVKMLAGRKISGEYKFSNGEVKTYTGSYELKALEFMDKVMRVDPNDLMCPGPILEYDLDGTTHIYITDFYYQPYNLIIEVKDGGDNPNKRNMPEYRAKQIAKENFIIKHTNYNYLRLTNNNLDQLLAVFANLKMQMVENTGDRVIHVNEAINSMNHVVTSKSKYTISKPYFVTGANGVPNCCVTIMGFNHPFRGKSTLIVLKPYKDTYKVFCKFHEDKSDIHIFPGGGWNPGEDPMDAATRETREECRINATDVEYCGELVEYNEAKVAKWVKEYIPQDKWWYGYYSKIYVGMYKSKYNGSIAEEDKDPEMLSGKWYMYSDIKDKICPVYAEAIDKYLENKLARSMNEEVMINPLNEMMNALMSGKVVGLRDSEAYITNIPQNNVFSGGIAVTDGRFDSIFAVDDKNNLTRVPEDVGKLIRTDNKVFYHVGNRKDVSAKLEAMMNKKVTDEELYESLTGIKLYDSDQIQYNLSATILKEFSTDGLEEYILGEKSDINNIEKSIKEVINNG